MSTIIMRVTQLNPEFARIRDLAIDAYGWFECDREPFLAKSNDCHYRIITLAKRSVSGMNDVRMLACTQQIMTHEIETVLMRIGHTFNLWGERDNFICLFQSYETMNAYKIGDEFSMTYQIYSDKILQNIR
jgi:hypothetical protein